MFGLITSLHLVPVNSIFTRKITDTWAASPNNHISALI